MPTGFFDPDPTTSLDDAYALVSMNYESDFQSYWGLKSSEPPNNLNADQWREFIDLHRLAKKLAAGAASLVRPAKLREQQLSLPAWLAAEASKADKSIDEIMEKLKGSLPEDAWWKLHLALGPGRPDDPRTKHIFFENCMQLEADTIFGQSIAQLAERMTWLTGFMVRRPGEFTQAYLSRVAECYVRDMKPELAVMCRAVLDVAIQEVISDEDVARTVGQRSFGEVTLERRIAACASLGFESHEIGAATRVRERGRDAAHFSPGLEGSTEDMIGDLADALSAIERIRPRK